MTSTGWSIRDDRGATTSVERIRAQYPDAVAYDESGSEVDLNDLAEDNGDLGDGWLWPLRSRRILIWATYADSEGDDGTRAIASATAA